MTLNIRNFFFSEFGPEDGPLGSNCRKEPREQFEESSTAEPMTDADVPGEDTEFEEESQDAEKMARIAKIRAMISRRDKETAEARKEPPTVRGRVTLTPSPKKTIGKNKAKELRKQVLKKELKKVVAKEKDRAVSI